jgi:hypothetical protein
VTNRADSKLIQPRYTSNEEMLGCAGKVERVWEKGRSQGYP